MAVREHRRGTFEEREIRTRATIAGQRTHYRCEAPACVGRAGLNNGRTWPKRLGKGYSADTGHRPVFHVQALVIPLADIHKPKPSNMSTTVGSLQEGSQATGCVCTAKPGGGAVEQAPITQRETLVNVYLHRACLGRKTGRGVSLCTTSSA